MARYFDLLGLRHRRPLILFFRDGGIGDILCTLPVAAELARREPRTYRIYCTNPAFVTLPRLVPGAFHRVLGIKCNDQVAHAARRHTVHRFRYPDEEPGQASTKYLVDEFAEASGLPEGLSWPNLELGEPVSRVQDLLRRGGEGYLCIHCGPTWAAREWPRDHWETLVARLRQQTGMRVLQIGATRHFRDGTRADPVIAGAEDCRDVYSLVETMQLVSRARLLVGIDSGMLHAAVALAVPAIGIFGPTRAALRLPVRDGITGLSAEVPCLGCHHRHPRLHWQSGCPFNIQCMQGVEAERVVEEALPFLGPASVAMI